LFSDAASARHCQKVWIACSDARLGDLPGSYLIRRAVSAFEDHGDAELRGIGRRKLLRLA